MNYNNNKSRNEVRVFSVTMTESELRLFSEFLDQKNFINVNVDTNELPESINNFSGSLENSTSNIQNGINSLGNSFSRGLGNLGFGLGLGIGTAGIAGAYSRIKAAKLAAKRHQDEVEKKYKTSDEGKKDKKREEKKKK